MQPNKCQMGRKKVWSTDKNRTIFPSILYVIFSSKFYSNKCCLNSIYINILKAITEMYLNIPLIFIKSYQKPNVIEYL